MRRVPVFIAALALVLAILPLASLYADNGSWNGWITDDACGAKGAKAEHADCAKKCMGKGAKLVFYNNADKKLYKLDKQDLAKEHIGHEVTVSGEVTGDSIAVASIAAAPPAK
ncbi:MAG TPA: DUF5818 domain-containing protein [Thermoanaerobaculia bacterium]|jgi:hypothetical protein